MALVKRGTKGSPISAAEYDAVVGQVETNQEAVEVIQGQFVDSEVTLSFADLAAATAYWNLMDTASLTPSNNVEIYLQDVNQFWKWDSGETAKAVLSRVNIEPKNTFDNTDEVNPSTMKAAADEINAKITAKSTANPDDADQTKLAQISAVKAERDDRVIFVNAKIGEIVKNEVKTSSYAFPVSLNTGDVVQFTVKNTGVGANSFQINQRETENGANLITSDLQSFNQDVTLVFDITIVENCNFLRIYNADSKSITFSVILKDSIFDISQNNKKEVEKIPTIENFVDSTETVLNGGFKDIISKVSTTNSIDFTVDGDNITAGESIPFFIRCENPDGSIPTSVTYQERSATTLLNQGTISLNENGVGSLIIVNQAVTIFRLTNIASNGYKAFIVEPIEGLVNSVKKDFITRDFKNGSVPIGVSWQSEASLQETIDANIVDNGNYYLVAEVKNAKLATFTNTEDGISTTVFLDANFDRITVTGLSGQVQEDFPLPENTKYIVSAVKFVDDNNRNYILLKENEDEFISDDYLNRYEEDVFISLPNKIALVEGENLQIFKDSIVSCSSNDAYSLMIEADSSTDLHRGEFLTQLLKTGGNTNTEQNLTFKLIDNGFRVVSQDSVKVIHTTKKTSPASQLNTVLIGNSFTDLAYYPAELAWRLSGVNGLRRAGNPSSGIQRVIDAPTVASDNLTNINFIGTKLPTNAGIYHEGWSGKTYEFFLGKDTDGQNNSPFWNGTAFDVDYYMNNLITNNGATLNLTSGDKIDVAVIILGTNSLTNTKFIKEFIDGMLVHNPSMKLIIGGVVINAPYNQFYKLIQTNLNYNKRLENICNEYSECWYVDILAQYDRMNNAGGLVEINANNRNSTLKRLNNSKTEVVHPFANGFYQIADAVYSAFHHFFL